MCRLHYRFRWGTYVESLTPIEFERVVAEEWPKAVPEKFRARVRNVEVLVEDEPSDEVRRAEGLEEGETLLGLYTGIPLTERGSEYGVGATMPDTITLYRLPILDEAAETGGDVRAVVRDTLWHECAHYFGMEEHDVRHREDSGTNTSI